jgi:tetratricopeptide (TPR) repeat protein
MKRRALLPALLAGWSQAGRAASPSAATTHSSIALANLDAQVRQQADEPDAMDLWLLRMQVLADYRMLDRVAALTEVATADPHALLRRARARAAAHRFTAALADVDAAQAVGAAPRAVAALRAAVMVAVGRAAEVVAALESEVTQRPGFASYAALARANGAAGRLADADRFYARALQALDSTSPLPTATTAFARGLMWSEQGGQAERGASHYVQALRAVPEFVAARIHLAEIEMARGDEAAAEAGLQSVVAASDEPEAWARLGELHLRQGQAARGQAEILRAGLRYEALLARHPAAFADHAAEFYLGAGADPQRAWKWAQGNLRERKTRRAYTLAIRAAKALGLGARAQVLRGQMDARHAEGAA